MGISMPFELLADAGGSVTFGWADERVYYARFTRSLSARLGETFAARLRAAARSVAALKYFADARDLESYDLLARGALADVIGEQRHKFEQLTVLWWDGAAPSPSAVSAMGESLYVTRDVLEFERRLAACAPRACARLGTTRDSSQRARWPLRR
jgi:hypothetical protein